MNTDKEWDTLSGQFCEDDDGNRWLVTELIAAAKEQGLEPFNLPVAGLCVEEKRIGTMPIREFVSHMRMVLDADLSHPIILDEDGALFDGRHRAAKALLQRKKNIKAVRFDKDPAPTVKATDEL